jgi:hypothetical protein
MSHSALCRWLQFAVNGSSIEHRRVHRRRIRRAAPARNWKYRAWVRSLASAVSGVSPCEAAHTGTDGGTSQKSSDYSCIPLTWLEHREYHRLGRKDFERRYAVSCREIVTTLNHAWFAHAREIK